VNDVVIGKHRSTSFDVIDDRRVLVDEIGFDVFRVFEGRDGDQVGDGKFSVCGQKVLSRQKIILEQLMRFHVLGPKFCENKSKLLFFLQKLLSLRFQLN
jgi:hypothetical protein